MQYSPKLKKAMEEIKAILKKHDIAGSVVLHAPGFSEYLNHINTSYSCLKFEGDNLRFKTKGRPLEHINDTVNMISHLAETSLRVGRNYFDMKEALRNHMDIEEEKGRHTGHTDQNN